MDATRAAGGEPLAIALIELAEAEPIFGHRQAVVRVPLEEAAALVETPALQGRILLRLAHVKLSEGDLEGVEQLVERARARLGDDTDRMLDAATLRARAAIRRKDFPAAEALLADASETVDDTEPATAAGRRAVAAHAIAWVELVFEQADYATAKERLEVLPSGMPGDDEDEQAEIDFACRQLRAGAYLAFGDHPHACEALREAVAIAKRAGGIEDELETRIALAGALTERADPTALDEAERHVQITRDKAIEAGLDSMHMAALVAQAGLLAKRGKTQAALDRTIEIAQSAAEKQDLPRYAGAVALMSQIYEQRGDLASAYRTFAEAHSALKAKMGDAATALFRPYLAALSERIGPETFREIAERVNKAAHARQTFRRRS